MHVRLYNAISLESIFHLPVIRRDGLSKSGPLPRFLEFIEFIVFLGLTQ